MNPSLTAAASEQLQEGINLVLSRWAALRMAIENEWGGRDSLQKSEELGHQLFHRLTQSNEQVYIDDLEDMLDELMLDLNTEIGDGSVEEIAKKLMVMREECLQGNFASIRTLRQTNVPNIAYRRQPGSNDEDDSDDDSGDDNMGDKKSMGMEIDTPQVQCSRNQKGTMNHETSVKDVPEVSDGWSVVYRSRNRGKRN
ncbi:hypothetical protein OROMI_012302 [Orobanche minor]